ncbi:DinB family protein [Acidipila sp. EB88]|uniref:DinB family protein n=1 Tax=Acidipila sp. EB88 TaxID=2305226 RepID=UPI000F5DAB97|nr:DinB family protein [Acidipila sp. EB88]RRA49838.1 DinB family protein [Acidipila sp. EB88]
MTLAERLLPELEQQLENTRKVLSEVPDGRNDFAPHEKSMQLTRLAGHTAELVGFACLHLTLPSINMGTPEDPRKILRMQLKADLVAEFEAMAARLVETLKATNDATFDESFTLLKQGNVVLQTTRYSAYRTLFLDHMIHHRAQLGVYLRLLGEKVPATFGPTADSK